MHGVPGFEHAGTAAPAAGCPSATLTGQDAQLLEQVAIRVADLVKASAAGRWPARELRALVGYLQAEVLRQAEDEEGTVFPAHHTPEGSGRLAGTMYGCARASRRWRRPLLARAHALTCSWPPPRRMFLPSSSATSPRRNGC